MNLVPNEKCGSEKLNVLPRSLSSYLKLSKILLFQERREGSRCNSNEHGVGVEGKLFVYLEDEHCIPEFFFGVLEGGKENGV